MVAHHVQVMNPHGFATKVSDYRTVPACGYHHSQLHDQGERSFWERFDLDPHEEIARYLMRWAKAHPDGNVREGFILAMEEVVDGSLSR